MITCVAADMYMYTWGKYNGHGQGCASLQVLQHTWWLSYLQEKNSPSLARHWLVDRNNSHFKPRTKSDGQVDKIQNLSNKKFNRSLQDISPKIKPNKRMSTALTSETVELSQDIDYEDLLVQACSKDIKLESETAKMIFKDISENRLSDKVVTNCCNHNCTEDKQLCSSDQIKENASSTAGISSCKSVSVLKCPDCQTSQTTHIVSDWITRRLYRTRVLFKTQNI